MKCPKCGETRESEFLQSRIKIRDYRCKQCVSVYSKRWGEAHREYFRNWARAHPELNKANFKRWYSNNAETQYERRLRYVRANPQRHNAQGYAWKAFPVAQVCGIEDCTTLGERHHEDYSKPLEIRWLCRKHHKELSRKI